jgi:integrase
MIKLPHDCYCSEISVHPKNWNSKKVKRLVPGELWYVQYRFYDPTVKGTDGKIKPKLCIIKGEINQLPTLEERRDAVDELIYNENILLRDKGYNPITGTMIEPPPEIEYEIDPSTPFAKALDQALQKLDGVKGTKDGARWVVEPFKVALEQLRYSRMPISTVRAKHVAIALDYMQSRDAKFSNAKYNRYRANLLMLFKQLKKIGAIEANYIIDVERKKKISRIRTTLTPAERKKIDKHLRTCNPLFHRFMEIFFHGGVRETELLMVKGKDVDLKNQRFKVLVKKGTEYREVWKVIKDIAKPLWKLALASCKPEDFVFAKGLRPGKVPITAKQISKRWHLWVKKPLKITADFYSLKHSNTTEIVDALDEQAAARMNSHTSTAMVVKIYDVGQKRRNEDRLKRVKNKFA